MQKVKTKLQTVFNIYGTIYILNIELNAIYSVLCNWNTNNDHGGGGGGGVFFIYLKKIKNNSA